MEAASFFGSQGFVILVVVLLVSVLFALMRKEKGPRFVTQSDIAETEGSDIGERIREEMLRSRRYNRPFSLVVVEAPRVDGKGSASRASVVSMLKSFMRRTDIGLFSMSDRLIYVCPETDSHSAAAFVKRIQKTVVDLTGAELKCAISVFPEHGVTLDGLLENAQRNLGEGEEYTVVAQPRRVVGGN